MRLVRAAARNQSRRLNVLHWLLLALRVAILLALACTVAAPFKRISRLSQTNDATPRRHVILVFDRSMSMQYQTDGTSRFQKAKTKALELVREARIGDGFSIVGMGNSVQRITRDVSFHKPSLVRAIESLQPTEEMAMASSVLPALQDLIQASQEAEPFDEIEIWLLTDLAESTWRETKNDSSLSVAATSALDQIKQRARFRVYPEPVPSAANRAVSDLFDLPDVIDLRPRILRQRGDSFLSRTGRA